jgi:hypothetical protein
MMRLLLLLTKHCEGIEESFNHSRLLLFNAHPTLSTKLSEDVEFYHSSSHQRKHAKTFHRVKGEIDVERIKALNERMRMTAESETQCTDEQFSRYIADLESIYRVPLPFRAIELFRFTRTFMRLAGLISIDISVELYHCPKGVDVGYIKECGTGIALSSFLEVASHGISFVQLTASL